MIAPRRSPAFTTFFTWHARRRIGRTFEELRVRGLGEMRARVKAGPVLVVSNHTAWWDPLVALVLAHDVDAEGYAMMDARNLRALPFFGLVGAFGVELESPRDGARAIRGAAKLLDRPGRMVWIYAQGQERPITLRPLGFRPGSAEVARVAREATVLPVGLRYEFGQTEKPIVFVSIGPAVTVSGPRAKAGEALERAVEAELDGIDAALVRRDVREFVPHLRGAKEQVAGIAERLLAAAARPGRTQER